MQLRDYLAGHGLTQTAFAERIGTSVAAVSRYCDGRVPDPEVMRRIFKTTEGEVTANDFVHGQEAA